MSRYDFYRNERLNQSRRDMERSCRLNKNRLLSHLIISNSGLVAESERKQEASLRALLGILHGMLKDEQASRSRQTIQ